MNTDHPIFAQLKRHEGLSLKLYRDSVGKLTIGYGRNLDDRGIDQDEADAMLFNDVLTVNEALTKQHPWADNLDAVRRSVLVNMVFNMGMSRFNTFVITLRFVQQGRYAEAAKEMLNSKWARQVGKRAIELSEQMRTGEWQQ